MTEGLSVLGNGVFFRSDARQKVVRFQFKGCHVRAEDSMSCRELSSTSTVIQSIGGMTFRPKSHAEHRRLPHPSAARLKASLNDTSYNIHQYVHEAKSKRETVLYLAYGSNLSTETFRGKRGIRPLAQINVQVPTLRLTFDLPGLPYYEPCFANSGLRDPNKDPSVLSEPHLQNNEKKPLLRDESSRSGYRKDNWHKGLIGVVYEVTAKDYAHIIATEGGGTSYQDIVVDCHSFVSDDPSAPVPQNPTLPPFKAHTLFAPAVPPEQPPPEDGSRFQRPDTSYAQASARYLKLMKDGAAELGLPYEYQDYLHSLRHYRITTVKQRIGQFVFIGMWVPLILSVFTLGKLFADKKGRLPGWLRQLTAALFKAVWSSYDKFFKGIFGDGERTLTDNDEVRDDESRAMLNPPRRMSKTDSTGHAAISELEKTISSAEGQ